MVAPPSSKSRVLVDDQGIGAEQAGVVARQELDPLLGVLEVLGAAPGESHALFEDLERLLQWQVPGLEPIDDLLEALQGVLEFDVAHRPGTSSDLMSLIPGRCPQI